MTVDVDVNVNAPPLDPAQVVVDAFRPATAENDIRLTVAEGEVPEALTGVLYRNGPGRLDVHGTPLTHPFDGDGMISRFAFTGGSVHYRNRYVRTAEYEAEARAGRILYRNFGTNLPGGLIRNLLRLKFKNPANTGVLIHGGRLLALWEGGLPHELDPDTLETRGRFDFGGRLRSSGLARVLAPEPPFSAHPRRCPRTGEVFNFGLQVAPRPQLLVYRLGPDGVLAETRKVELPDVSFIHDFTLTERFAVFFLTPVHFDVVRALSGWSSPVESIRRRANQPTTVLLVPRDGGAVRRIELNEGFFLFHLFNAFEENGTVVVDGCRMDDFPGGTADLSRIEDVRNISFDPGYPTRWRIDLSGAPSAPPRVDTHRLSDVAMELPTIDPRWSTRAHNIGFATARLRPGPPVYTGLARIDFGTGEVQTLDLAPDLPGEPLLLPTGPAQGQGLVSTVVYRARSKTSELQLRDPTHLDVVCRLPLPHHQPPGFHGAFVEAAGQAP